MTTARYGGVTYSVELAESPSEREAAYALRASEYQSAQSYLLLPEGALLPAGVPHRAADVYDERSFIFSCRETSENDACSPALATCRFTVPQRGRFELDDLTEGWERPPVPAEALVETSRVVVRRDVRAMGLVEVMLLLAGSWLLEETPLRYNFAVCARPLERLYARLGMGLVTDGEVVLRGRPIDRRYVVIYGDMAASRPTVMQRLTAHGWDFSPSILRKAGT